MVQDVLEFVINYNRFPNDEVKNICTKHFFILIYKQGDRSTKLEIKKFGYTNRE